MNKHAIIGANAPRNDGGLSRRDVLRLGGIGSLVAMTGAMGVGCEERKTPAPAIVPQPPAVPAINLRAGRKPRNIIFMVSDGMSTGVPSLAEPFSRLTRGRGTHWHRLMTDRQLVHGQLATHSLNSLVTDSSAAASAWGSGSRVNNGALNVLPDGTKLTPITALLADHGMRVGLVTTDLMTGATPAGFAAVAEKRTNYDHIAPQFRGHVDVILGGGRANFDALTRADRLDLIGEYQKHGYEYLGERAAVLAKPPAGRRRVLGLFGESQLPYTIDHSHNESLRARVPTLAEMTRYALWTLGAAQQGFFIMVEGARIDHAAHTNDAAAMLWEQLAFDDAIGEALAFTEGREDTLLVVTSDHGNGNPGLCGMGGSYSGSTATFAKLKDARASFGEIHRVTLPLAQNGDVTAVGNHIRNMLGIDLTAGEAAVVTKAIANQKLENELWEQQRPWSGALTQALANHTGVSFNGRTHTNDHVILTALGPGAEHFAGLTEHPEVFRIFTSLRGINHTNPSAEPQPHNANQPAPPANAA